ncbi:DUF427 domain-containing protein [Streptomyces sp. NPDC019443]|uniref:DUF427 domain-containing protein n=1 Tax=Streptomyces sp. NPDC019443 TaxID=3365061 RepID=UPI0037A1E647
MPNTHPDPDHRVTAVPGTQHIRVEIDGQLVSSSSRPVLVYETGLPVRYYLPAEDVNLTLFEPTDTHTTCPYKGEASYWSFHGGNTGADAAVRTDVAWSYQEPLPSVLDIKGYLSFYDNVADIQVTGEAPEPPAV